MKVSDLILELQEFYQQYGDLDIAAIPPHFVNGQLSEALSKVAKARMNKRKPAGPEQENHQKDYLARGITPHDRKRTG